jgi:hypothetical protein
VALDRRVSAIPDIEEFQHCLFFINRTIKNIKTTKGMEGKLKNSTDFLGCPYL